MVRVGRSTYCHGLPVSEVASRLAISEASVRALVASGELPAFRPKPRTIRIPALAVQIWLAKRRTAAESD
jgi:excisionase family DNA binding protein